MRCIPSKHEGWSCIVIGIGCLLYSVFGQYILTPEVFEQLRKNINDGVVSERGEVELTTALEQVCQKEGLMGVQLEGEMFDIGIPQELRKASFNFLKL